MKFIEDKVATTCEKLLGLSKLKPVRLDGFTYQSCDYKRDGEPIPTNGYEPYDPKLSLIGKDKHFWFHKQFTTPPKSQEGRQLIFELQTGMEGWDALNPQGLLYLDGKMVQGFDVNHTEAVLDYDTTYDMHIYFYLGMHDSRVSFLPSLYELDTKIQKLYYDLHVPLDACRVLGYGNEDYIRILRCLELALSELDLCKPYSDAFYRSVDRTIDYLDRELYHGLCGKGNTVVNCIGHTHIDVAWLWTLAQTKEKAQRSFSTVLSLMRRYPEFKFMSSQPQLYQYVKEAAPELYAEIKQAVKEKRWEVEGAMWLEADVNISSGESLVRQILFGKRFMQKEFGVDSKIVWLPDVFGYTGALPQIMKKCGVDKFFTTKIGWNEFNKFPYDTFMWQGIDGTEIFTSFITAQDYDRNNPDQTTCTYVGYIRPSQVYGSWHRYQQKEYNNETLITFGFGDGGGGPTADMLEQQRRLSYGLPGFPRTVIDFAGNYLNRVEANFEASCKQLKRTPRWVGELYLELHRGTYTSIAKNKKNNRDSELLYQRIETLSVMDTLLNAGTYPQEAINKNWQTILLNQFHDIIPGSSIFEVYEDCDKDYARVLSEGREIESEKLDALSDKINTAGGVWVYNPNSFAYSGPVDLEGKKAGVDNIPPMGWAVVEPVQQTDIQVTTDTIESAFYLIRFDDRANIISLYDKQNERECIQNGARANELQAFEDIPKCYDAWEITNYYKQKMYLVDDVVSVTPFSDGASAGLVIVKRFLDSTIEQRIRVYDNSRRIDFETTIDWKQEQLLLKAAFPLDIHTNRATYDIQFGSIERPTHENTSWDAAKFEVCAQKWADLSDGSYGVSLLNDCKYGYSTEGSTLKLTLLKSALYPNPKADKELHRFTYSLLPHAGTVTQSDTVQQAYGLNQRPIAKRLPPQKGTLPERYSFVSCDRDNVIIETIKKAEDSDDCIIRLYETANQRTNVTLTFSNNFDQVYTCDMLEQNQALLAEAGSSVTFPIRGYEICTLKLCGIKAGA